MILFLQPGYRPEFERLYYSQMSQAILQVGQSLCIWFEDCHKLKVLVQPIQGDIDPEFAVLNPTPPKPHLGRNFPFI